MIAITPTSTPDKRDDTFADSTVIIVSSTGGEISIGEIGNFEISYDGSYDGSEERIDELKSLFYDYDAKLIPKVSLDLIIQHDLFKNWIKLLKELKRITFYPIPKIASNQPLPRPIYIYKPWRLNRLIGKREKRIGLKR